jgi:tetratricopeptide (TPR) repeat protein/tRNA A-37 threonylcarbamoyl transferase component Bud32
MPSTCPPEAVLRRLLIEPLETDIEEDLERHLQSCVACRESLDRLAQHDDSLGLPELQRRPVLSKEFVHRLEDSLQELVASEGSNEEPAPPVLEGYELFEVIGRGGASIVYRARDLRLQRTVAIKVLRERAGKIVRERFRREARALAALHHPNIIRVIEVGESRGQVFLVLEYVAGQSLSQFTAGEPQLPDPAARLVRQIADAMHRAHEAGLVHRDLKPGNILLDPCFGPGDGAGLDRFVPRVTDFGIVKDLNEDESLTRTRDCLGTPSYMAPEQVRGGAMDVDCRTDVYAIGALLYELLTGRPPFRASTPMDTMLLVRFDEPVAPSRLQSKVPRALETICLKCLEKSPGRRYVSALQLAEDLDRYLEGRPVLARPTPGYLRAWQWSRRHPGWAAASVCLLVMLLTAGVGGPLLAHHQAALRADAERNEQLANNERTRAHAHLDLASQALEQTLDQTLRSARLLNLALDDVRANLIRGAAPYLEQFVQLEASDRSLQLRQCRSLLQLASLHTQEEDRETARGEYLRAMTLLNDIQKKAPQDQTVWSVQASANLEYGRFLHIENNQTNRAEKHYQEALSIYRRLIELHPTQPQWRDQGAIVLSLLGAALMKQPDRLEDARKFHLEAIRLREQLVAELPNRHDLRHYAALTRMNLGMLHRQLGEREDEIREMRLALEMEKPLSEVDEIQLEAPYFLATLHGELGVALFRNGQRGEALPHLTTAARTAEALTIAYPSVKKYAALHHHWQEALDFATKDTSKEKS